MKIEDPKRSAMQVKEGAPKIDPSAPISLQVLKSEQLLRWSVIEKPLSPNGVGTNK